MQCSRIISVYRLFVAHSNIFDPCSLSSHGHFYDRNTDYPKHVLHFLHEETKKQNHNDIRLLRGNVIRKITAFYIKLMLRLDCATLEL